MLEGTKVVAIEGIDRSGKSTIIRLLTDKLEVLGYKVIVIKDFYNPDNYHYVSVLRKLVLYNRDKIDNRVYAFLYGAARLDTINQVEEIKLSIEPTIVILDRYVWSTLTYQSVLAERQEDKNLVEYLSHYFLNLLRPDLNVLIDINYDTFLERNKTFEMDTMEEEFNKDDKYIKLIESYRELFKDKTSYITLDNNKPERLDLNVNYLLGLIVGNR